MREKPRMRLGEALVARGLLTEKQLELALQEQRHVERPLGQILVDLGFVESIHLAEHLAEDVGLPLVRAADVVPDPVLVSALDADFVREVRAFPIEVVDGRLRVAMCDPANPELLSALRQRFAMSLEVEVLPDEDLVRLVRKHLTQDSRPSVGLLARRPAQGDGDDSAPIEELTEALILQAIHRGATDVHFQPEASVTRVRYRLDGVLQQADVLPADVTNAVVSRIKILAGLDIAERRRPQDGRINLDVDGRRVPLRVSMMPVANGESVVLRVLDRSSGSQRLGDLGIADDLAAALRDVVGQPHGLFLVTGPTGSGKTTTLYAMLHEVDALRRNVATVEDPIEYDLPFVRQSQVDLSVGFDFHSGLRALLRQDPDVILVGEIRDEETAETAVKASMTGHLVFATLHTNTAVGAIPRLCDLGVAPYLIEDTLIGVLAQRLVRRNCEECARDRPPTPSELAWLGGRAASVQSGDGCDACAGSGYASRIAITELLLPDESFSSALRKGHGPAELRRLAEESGFREMSEDGREKVLSGLTTVAEVQRVTRSRRAGKEPRRAA